MTPSTEKPPVVVWGNCQSTPLAAMLTEPLLAHGWQVHPVPPVFEVDQAGLAEVHRLMANAALLVTQPIKDEYRIPGCGSNQLAALLGDDAQVVTFPVTYDTSAFPYQVNAHRGDGTRVDAPLTDYHDLRTIVAAERGLSVDDALDWWPAPTPEMVRSNADGSVAELHRREADLDVQVSDLLAGPAMFTLSHPTNAVLAETARRVLTVLGIEGDIDIPTREFLGARRAPIEAPIVETLGWSADVRHDNWIINGSELPQRDVLSAQLDFYATYPDIITDTRTRFARRLELLEL